MYFSVDRKMPGKVVLMGEDGKPLEVSYDLLPKGVREGDMLLYKNGAFLPDAAKTDERRQRMGEMLSQLLRQGGGEEPGGGDE